MTLTVSSRISSKGCFQSNCQLPCVEGQYIFYYKTEGVDTHVKACKARSNELRKKAVGCQLVLRQLSAVSFVAEQMYR